MVARLSLIHIFFDFGKRTGHSVFNGECEMMHATVTVVLFDELGNCAFGRRKRYPPYRQSSPQRCRRPAPYGKDGQSLAYRNFLSILLVYLYIVRSAPTDSLLKR